MPDNWAWCDHDWREVDSQMTDPERVAVVCRKCQCPGEKWLETGEVEWPTT